MLLNWHSLIHCFMFSRFGKFNRILDAGLHFLIPVVSSQLLQGSLLFVDQDSMWHAAETTVLSRHGTSASASCTSTSKA